MVLEHEIPRGSKLHFGLSAKIKRHIENLSANIFYDNGFEEIVSPVFIHQEHQRSFLDRNVIHLSGEKNHQVLMRNDSTIDVIRIITKRLGRSTKEKKWFYIQPVFSYPTLEFNQIGAEYLDENGYKETLRLSIEIFNALGIKPILQITNTKIAKLCAKESGLENIHFTKLNIEKLQSVDYIVDLLNVSSTEDLASKIDKLPRFLREEIMCLLESCRCDYDNVICSPLLSVPIDYYNVFFRMFLGNATFLYGGRYCIDEVSGTGFGIYTDNVIHHLLKNKDT